LAHGLKELLKYEKDDVEQAFELNFQIQFDNYGVMETYDLVENGADVPVTKANREGSLWLLSATSVTYLLLTCRLD
jgi:hypothetical protein